MKEDAVMLREMVKFFGVKRTAQLLGYATVFAVLGDEPKTDLDRVTLWRFKRDLRAFGKHMYEQGHWQKAEITVEEFAAASRGQRVA